MNFRGCLNKSHPQLILIRSLSRGLPKLTTNFASVTYDNAELQKKVIFKENKNKNFVYRWVNKVNGKDYLGSTSNAKSRLSTYYDRKSLELVNMPIYKAILKYGHSKFKFEIIEYCEAHLVVQREQYYLDHFDFDYNILDKADSLLGYKHTIETLAKMKGRKNALGYKHTLETLNMLRLNQTDKKHSEEAKSKMRELWSIRKLDKTNSTLDLKCSKELEESHGKNSNDFVGLRPPKFNKGKLVVVTNIDTNLSTEYASLTEAALALNITRTTLRTYIKNKKVFTLLKRDSFSDTDSKSDCTNLIKEKYIITIATRNK